MEHSGRNKSCPCGSGMTYGECCGKNETAGWTPRVIDDGLSTNGPPLSIDQLNTVLGRAMKDENERSRNEFIIFHR